MEITQEIIDEFRVVYPEFSNTIDFTDAQINRALCKGDRETLSNRWGAYADCTLKQDGLFSFGAHWLILRLRQTNIVNGGGTPGAIAPTTSKTVGDESESFGVATAQNLTESGEAALASTSYGQEFMRLRRRAGMGAVAV